jgi:hypothetical protein
MCCQRTCGPRVSVESNPDPEYVICLRILNTIWSRGLFPPVRVSEYQWKTINYVHRDGRKETSELYSVTEMVHLHDRCATCDDLFCAEKHKDGA